MIHRARVGARWLPAAVALALTACVPLPYAAPPAQIHVGGGGAFGDTSRGVFRLQADLAPFGYFGAIQRAWDVRAGYLLEAHSGDRGTRHGAALAGDWYLSHPEGLTGGHRLGLTAQGVWRTDAVGGDGGLLWQFVVPTGTPFAELNPPGSDDDIQFPQRSEHERDDPNTDPPDFVPYSQHDDGDDGDQNVGIIGYAAGELGVGLRLTGGVRRLDQGTTEYLAIAGLDVRLPASFGVLLLWLTD
ncbi:MAG: hypothetical protein H6702_21740 [Myxococcales bacterium]|nr:hypothetical protein [Myxococcales bacterium]